MRHVGVLEAKTQLSALLDAVEKTGEPVVITRHGKAVARLSVEVPFADRPRRLTGEELLARSRALRAAQSPDPEPLSWEAMKAIARDERTRP